MHCIKFMKIRNVHILNHIIVIIVNTRIGLIIYWSQSLILHELRFRKLYRPSFVLVFYVLYYWQICTYPPASVNDQHPYAAYPYVSFLILLNFLYKCNHPNSFRVFSFVFLSNNENPAVLRRKRICTVTILCVDAFFSMTQSHK